MTPTFDFDRIIDRRGADSLKWLGCEASDTIPMPVADMDFASPPEVIEALHRRADHGVFGYAIAPREAVEAVVEALARDHAWDIEPSWIVWLPGVVPGIGCCCRMLEPGDAAVTFTPIYPPFLDPSILAGRAQARIPLTEGPLRWKIGFDALESSTPANARLLMLCNPQNPTGTVLSRTDLEHLAGFALSRDMVIMSDEIHCDLILDPARRHIPTATLSPDVAARTVTFMAPSKTYNLAGLGCAFAVIPDPTLRRRFRGAAGECLPFVNAFGYAACAAAYRHGEPWRLALLDYLRGNRDLVESEVRAMPGLAMRRVEATYLAWIDGRGARWPNPAAACLDAGVRVLDGSLFGAPGFARLNFGCPRARLAEALRRIRSALNAT